MTYKTDFPDFDDVASCEALLAAGWEDTTWFNDTCPAFTKGKATIYVEYENVDMREYGEGDRFTVYTLDDEGCYLGEHADFAPTLEAALKIAEEIQRKAA